MNDLQRRFLLRLKKVPCPTRRDLGECWEFDGAKDDQGYGKIKVRGKVERAHRVSYMLFVGPLKKEEVVRHRCDNPPCCRPTHVNQKGTQLDNMADKVARGRQVNANKKLDTAAVEYIRDQRSRGVSPAVIARRLQARGYDVARSTVSAAETGQNHQIRFDLMGVKQA